MGKMDPYVKWKHGEKTYKTTVQKDAGKKPIWGEIFKLPIIDRTINTQLSFQVFDEETFKDDVIGECKVDIQQLLVPGDCCFPLVFKGSQNAGTICWTSEWEEDTKENIANVWGSSSATPKADTGKTPKSGGFFGLGHKEEAAPVAAPIATADIAGNLTLTVKKAELTHDTETFGKMDPYAMWEYEGNQYKTTTKDNAGKKPVWNETFNMTVSKKDVGCGQNIQFSVMDKEGLGKDKLIADAAVSIDSLLRNGDNDVPIMFKSKVAGNLHLSM